MISNIEELSMSAWPALQTKLYDGWVLRFADGYTKRSNSINPIYDSTISLHIKLDFCEKEYEQAKLPIVYKLTPDSQPRDIDEELDKRGYITIDETSVRVLEMDHYYQAKVEGIHIETEFSDTWIKGFINCSGINERDQMTANKMLSNIIGEVVCVSKRVREKVIGCGFGVIERDYIGIFDIIVDKSYRGNGYGKNIMYSILNTAAEKGVKTAYLQVVVGNKPAENLYKDLGFQEEYKYWYRVKNF